MKPVPATTVVGHRRRASQNRSGPSVVGLSVPTLTRWRDFFAQKMKNYTTQRGDTCAVVRNVERDENVTASSEDKSPQAR